MKEIALAFSKIMDSFLAYFTTACTHHADVVSRKTCRTPEKPRICGYNEDPTFTGGHKKWPYSTLTNKHNLWECFERP
jgi:hypothetical protein